MCFYFKSHFKNCIEKLQIKIESQSMNHLCSHVCAYSGHSEWFQSWPLRWLWNIFPQLSDLRWFNDWCASWILIYVTIHIDSDTDSDSKNPSWFQYFVIRRIRIRTWIRIHFCCWFKMLGQAATKKFTFAGSDRWIRWERWPSWAQPDSRPVPTCAASSA